MDMKFKNRLGNLSEKRCSGLGKGEPEMVLKMSSEMQPHGIMFHHFHDNAKYLSSQGSISAEELSDIIAFYQRKGYEILNAEDWLQRALNGRLCENHVVLTFDDGLRCQYDIALPVLEKHRIKGCWFVNTAYFHDKILPLEIFRQYRHHVGIEQFYEQFLQLVKDNFKEIYQVGMATFPEDYLADSKEYSDSDRLFRYFRDVVLGETKYSELITKMMTKDGFTIPTTFYINPKMLVDIARCGHVIGFHSHSHPHNMPYLPLYEQYSEYAKNILAVERIVMTRDMICNIKSMSHPSSIYNGATLKILQLLGIQVGFRANMEPVADRTLLEMPRLDHALIMMEMRK